MRLLVSLFLCLVFFSITACANPQQPTRTPDIPATVTAQVDEHLATLPTATPLPTYTPYPTFTPLPTVTPKSTLLPAPTYTPHPSYTPFPTSTPTPTPRPTPTPTETHKWGIPNKPIRVGELYTDPSLYARSKQLILRACYTGVDIEGSGIFSQSGGFSEQTKFVAVAGITTRNLSKRDCLLIGVRNVGKETYCYWTSFIEWPSTLGCPSFGWESLTLKFRVTPIGAFEKTSRY